MANFIDAGFWVVLPLTQVRSLAKDFRLSPVVVKEEVNCRPRVIVDHTWFGVNNHTVVELPREVMQFGGALSRILWLLRHADPNHGLVYMAKYVLSDGFYRMFLDPAGSLKLSVLMPRYDGEPQLVAIPLSTMMRWVSSPPTFCAASETIADLANASLYKRTVPPHRLEDAASFHNCWEPSRQTLRQEELSSPAVHGPLATKTHRWGESSPLAMRGPLATKIHRRGESSPLAVRGPLATDTHRCEAPSSLAVSGPLAMMISMPSSLAGNQPRPLPQLADYPPPLLTLPGPVAHVDVFIGNFIGLAQGS